MTGQGTSLVLPWVCRWYPTVLTLPSGNILIVGGSYVASGSGGTYYSQNPTYQILNPATLTLSYKTNLPTSILLDAVPFALYPLMWQLPHTPSILARSPPSHGLPRDVIILREQAASALSLQPWPQEA